MDIDKMMIVYDLQDKYKEKYGENSLPNEYYKISDFDIKKNLLEKALTENIRLEEMDYLKRLHDARMSTILESNINKYIEKNRMI